MSEKNREHNIASKNDHPGSWKIWDASEIEDWEVEPAWVIEPIIPEGAVGFMRGPTMTYKSFMALDLSLHIFDDRPSR
ncbi:AAA family ATPase [Acidobacteria bacterium AH-259-O06]|nr:AAA family ATPase [Acidobacteria bacterium AH-259-O06]